MFLFKKLISLPPQTRKRKLILLLQKAETELKIQGTTSRDYWLGLLRSLQQAPAFVADFTPPADGRVAELVSALELEPEPSILIRAFDNLRHALLKELGAEPAEWDLLDFETKNPIELINDSPSPGVNHSIPGLLDADQRRVLPLEVYLESIRSPFNVGSIFRTAEAFGVSHIYLSPDTPLPTHPRAIRTARGCQTSIPWSVASLAAMNDKPEILALETGGTALQEFCFPSSGLILIGSEELGLSPEALALAQNRKGRVSIPMSGSKRSLNVAVAFGIVMWQWVNAFYP